MRAAQVRRQHRCRLVTPQTIEPVATSDKIRIIAMTGDKRSPPYMHLPTIVEAGLS